jgi:hypothetical protein
VKKVGCAAGGGNDRCGIRAAWSTSGEHLTGRDEST